MKRLAKTRKFISKNITSLIFFMMLLVMVLIVILVVSVLVPTARTSQYGDRLEGITKVEINAKDLSVITKSLKDDPIVEDAVIRLSGRIINIEIKLNGTGTIDLGKTLGNTIITKFQADEIAYYDFQVFITSTGSEAKTVIGYKTPKAEALTWTNN